MVDNNPAGNVSEKSSYKKKVEVKEGRGYRRRRKSCGNRL
jgi:hypothetical protein